MTAVVGRHRQSSPVGVWLFLKRGETPQTWKEFCAEQKECRAFFPAVSEANKYMRISQYPSRHQRRSGVSDAVS